jgi:hypothetical protein
MGQRQGNGRHDLFVCGVTGMPADSLCFRGLLFIGDQLSSTKKTVQQNHDQYE